ncbi:MAG: hypothetical protein KDA85_03925 [Planctomycetaceae bacterium]|nr:hypothetical protein [Planctomycetaceae bacterium]
MVRSIRSHQLIVVCRTHRFCGNPTTVDILQPVWIHSLGKRGWSYGVFLMARSRENSRPGNSDVTWLFRLQWLWFVNAALLSHSVLCRKSLYFPGLSAKDLSSTPDKRTVPCLPIRRLNEGLSGS